MMIASLHSRTAERTPSLGAGEVVPEDPGAFAAGRGAEGFVPFAMPGLSGLSVGQSAGRPVCRSASLPVCRSASLPVRRMGLGPSRLASRPVNEREGRDSCPSTGRRSPSPALQMSTDRTPRVKENPRLLPRPIPNHARSSRRFRRARPPAAKKKGRQVQDQPVPCAGLLHGVQGILAQNLAEGDQESVAFPIRSPQSPILNPQSPILNPQSPILNPQSPILNPQSPILNPQSPIRNPQSPIRNPQSPILNPQSPILNPQSPILNPQSAVPPRSAAFR